MGVRATQKEKNRAKESSGGRSNQEEEELTLGGGWGQVYVAGYRIISWHCQMVSYLYRRTFNVLFVDSGKRKKSHTNTQLDRDIYVGRECRMYIKQSEESNAGQP